MMPTWLCQVGTLPLPCCDACLFRVVCGDMSKPCRTDNGICLARIAHPGRGSRGLIQFTDGKVYIVRPFYPSDAQLHPSLVTQPGCWFNDDLKLRPGFSAVRLTEWLASASFWPFSFDYRCAEDRGHDAPVHGQTELDRALQWLMQHAP